MRHQLLSSCDTTSPIQSKIFPKRRSIIIPGDQIKMAGRGGGGDRFNSVQKTTYLNQIKTENELSILLRQLQTSDKRFRAMSAIISAANE